jgi:hypothetical protein
MVQVALKIMNAEHIVEKSHGFVTDFIFSIQLGADKVFKICCFLFLGVKFL